MEIQRVCVPVTEVRYLWQLRICDPFSQGPIVSLIGQCIFWMVIFCCYHHLKLFFQGRRREERQLGLLRDEQNHSKTERGIIEQMLTPAAKCTHAGATVQKSSEPVPVSICVDNTCGVELFADLRLREAASLLRVPSEGVTFLQTSAGPVAQTRMTRLTLLRTKPSKSTEASAQKRERFIVQFGRWLLIFRPSTESKGAKKMQLSTNDTNQVPVILHSSYSAEVSYEEGTVGSRINVQHMKATGLCILTVEGLHLTQANIQAVTKDNYITLKTKYEAGPGGLEVFTSESELPSKNLAEVFVLASKNIVANGEELRVNSLAVRIQNDSLSTVIRSVIPFTIFVFFATRQILVSVMGIIETTNTASIVAWLLLSILLVTTLVLPLRTETTIAVTLKKLAMRAYYTLYFAAQCFVPGKDPELFSMIEGVSRLPSESILKHGGLSSFQSGTNVIPTPLDDLEYSDGEPEDIDGKPNHTDGKPNRTDGMPDCKSKHSDREPVPDEVDSDVVNPEWEWPLYDTVHNKHSGDYLIRRVKNTENSAKDRPVPFSVVYLNLKDFPWASQVIVRIHSAFLIEIIKELMPREVDQSAIVKKEVKLGRPELFRICEKLGNEKVLAAEQEASGASSSGNGEKLLHLNHLLRFLDQEFKQTKMMFASMSTSERRVSWEMLWAFFPPGERVIYKDNVTEENLCGDVLETRYYQDDKGLFFLVEVSKWDYNCRTWTDYSRRIMVPVFKGEREILKLDIYPVQFTSNPEALIQSFKKQGKKFCKLSMLERNCFMNYKGSMMRYKVVNGCHVLVKENADGRVMVDLGSFAKMNPGSNTLGSAQPPCEVIRDNKVTKIDITSKDTRMFAPAIVYGFSFRLKNWGCFSVCGFSKIFFNSSAYDDLVMEADTKEIIENLVRKQLDDGKDVDLQDRERVDPIASKGEGTIILCYGPPGTGKTLTAESLSEKLRCPLWCLSVSELGITPATLETMLVKVMDVAASWGALLLLDEADVFLEKRTASDLTRNAMTGVFLRQLEYYRGVLFLTTNRDSAFDDAMCSRIAMFLHYTRHNEDQRKTIWTKMFERVGLNGTTEELMEFAKPEFNGREIRNIIKTAHTLSRSKSNEGQLDINHVRRALKVYEASSKIWGRNRENPASERVLDGWKKIKRTLSAGSLTSWQSA